MKRFSVKYDNVVDLFFWVTLFLLSAHDLTIRLIPQIPWGSIEILSFFVFLLLTIISKKRFNYRILVFFLCFYTIILISMFFSSEYQKDIIINCFISSQTILRVWGYVILFSQMDYKKIQKGLLFLAYINMTLLTVTTLSGLYSSVGRDVNYLGIGITSAVWIPIIMQAAFYKNEHRKSKILNIVLTLLFSAFAIIYGNRGSVLAIFLFLVYCILYYTNFKKKLLLLVFISILFLLFFANGEAILKSLINMVNSLGVNSRNLDLLINNQLSYSAHRTDEIWVNVLSSIKENWFLGYGLCYDRVISGYLNVYAHNLILEVWLSFGLIFGTLILLVYFIKGLKICFNKDNSVLSKLFSPFFISITTVLMFNNSFCQLGFFWASFGILLSYFKYRNNEEVIIK
ncbi:MAG: O-antigen ligase family protein [Candidatus Aphodocola sp.]